MRRSRAPLGPRSFQQRCTRPPCEVLIAEESIEPTSSSPSSIIQCASLTVMKSLTTEPVSWSVLYWFNFMKLTLDDGIAIDMICLPVQSGPLFGDLIIVGIGIRPSKEGTCMRMFMSRSFSTNVLRREMAEQPRRVSCTIPITGAFFCGETIWNGTIITLEISDFVS